MAQIKKNTSLRKAILQAALTGQLISSCHSELDSESAETGKELLDKIIEERNNKLLAEWEEKQTDLFASNDAHSKNAKTVRSEQIRLSKKIKKPEPIVASEINEEELPFEIPENWCWCRFGEITINRDSERIPLSVSQRELLEKKYDYYGASGIIDKVDNYLFDKDLLLIGEDGANLLTRSTPIAFIASGKYWVNNHAHVIDCNSNYINLNYIKFFINAISLAKYVTGTAQPKMNQEKMNSIPVALPPLAVQNAIVAKLEQVLPLVDAYENALLQKEELKSSLPDKVKKAILQEAITGKLTENWRKIRAVVEPVETTESGKQLLDRIIAERNKKLIAEWEEAKKTNPKAKKPAPIVASLQYDQDGRLLSEVEAPFEVPENWCWCRLGEIGDWGAGATPNRSKKEYYSNEGIPWIKTGELNNGIVTTSEEFITEKALKECSLRYNKIGDVMIAMYGATIGKVAIAGIELTTNQACCACTTFDGVYNKYLFYFLMANKENFIKQGEGGAQPNISREKIVKTLIPLPPLAEQEEIVRKVEELLAECTGLGK